MDTRRSKLLHILGGGPWQLPTLRRAKAMGHRVLVTDYHDERPAYALADAHEVVDITDAERTLEAARRHAIDGILCDTTDTGVRTAAWVADRLGLPGAGLDAAAICTDKARLRAAAETAGLASPRHRVVADAAALTDAARDVGLPLVTKPLDNQSGRGVSMVDEVCALSAAYDFARAHSRRAQVLLEARVHGIEYIVDGFVVNGTAQLLGIASKQPYADNPTIASRIIYLGGDEFDAAQRQLGPATHQLLRSVGLRGGIFHAEFIVGTAGAVVPIDLAARGGGVMIYTHVLPHVSGVDAVQASISQALAEPVNVQPTERRAACIEFLRAPPGRLDEVAGAAQAEALPGVAAVHIGLGQGEQCGALRTKDDRAGFIVALADASQVAIETAVQARSGLTLRMNGDAALRPFD